MHYVARSTAIPTTPWVSPKTLHDVGVPRLSHRGLVCPAVNALLEGCHVQPYFLRIGLELLRAGFWRVREERVVISPELPLVMGAPGRLMSLPRRGVEVVDRIIPEDELNLVAVLRFELPEGRQHPLTDGAVKVRELDDCHRRRRRPPERSPVHTHLGPEDRWGLQMHHDLSLGAEGLHKGLPLGGQLLLQVGSNP